MNRNLDFAFYNESWYFWLQDNLEAQNLMKRNKVLLSRSIKLSSDRTREAYRTWGNLYADFNDHPKSLVKLKRALAIKPNSSRIIQEVADVLNILKRHEEALVHHKKALELTTDRISVHSQFLKTIQLLEKFEDFESYYEEFLNHHPAQRTNSNFYYAKAEALVGLQKHDLSLKNYKKALEINPDDFNTAFQYGMALYHEGFMKEALQAFERVVVLEPTNKHAYNNVAFLNYNLGHIHEAIAALEYIVENDLEIYATYSNLILMNYHVHQNQEAIMHFYEKLKAYIASDYDILKQIYNEDLRLTELKLTEDLDEETKDFNLKKLSGLKLVISLIG